VARRSVLGEVQNDVRGRLELLSGSQQKGSLNAVNKRDKGCCVTDAACNPSAETSKHRGYSVYPDVACAVTQAVTITYG
jgi:hypothetical protein